MKDSHFKTPRSMAEGQWSYNADPIEHYGPGYDWQDAVVVTACAIAALAAMFILLFWEVAP